jgi:hypothetical protein
MRNPPTLLVVNGSVLLQSCTLYKGHLCAVTNDHHICPKSWFERAGVLVQTPMILLCPNCHMNVHAAIDGKIRGRLIVAIPPRCRTLADQAFALAQEHGLTPGLTL